MAKVLVVEPWYGGSHRVWLDGWRTYSRHELELVTQADRYWRWRMRAGAVDAATRVNARSGPPPDVVVVSSLLDASVFAGLTRHTLGAVPLAVYMHENQLLYPTAPNQRRDDDLALANWRSLVAADAIWWNSDFHRDAMLGALDELLGRQPEPAAAPDTVALRGRSTTLAPGVALTHLLTEPKPVADRPVVLWNQRWDHDKKPRAVLSALVALAGEGLEFDVILAGENSGHDPGLADLVAELGSRVRRIGFLEPAAYRRSLLEADVVVSAADHEFFGIAVVEAMAAGAVPVLPDRLSFPGLVGEQWADAALYPDGDLRRRLRTVVGDIEAARRSVEGLRASMARFDVERTAAAHDDAVEQLLRGRQGSS